jgi:DNA invertase Pin-like site-specific DNA recombinase
MKRAALYMRVSTKGHGQTTETQAVALRDYAAHRGFQIIEEYRDEGISGSKYSRPALDRLMKDARARKFDVVIVARFDRFARSVESWRSRACAVQSLLGPATREGFGRPPLSFNSRTVQH